MATQEMGLLHFINQGDIVSKALFVILLSMSIASWFVIIMKVVKNIKSQQASNSFLEIFWQSKQFSDATAHTKNYLEHSPYARLTDQAITAKQHHERLMGHSAESLADTGTDEEFLTRTLRHHLDQEITTQENGMTLLATISATAPFVGLFGTVWGVYHALIKIGATGAGTIDKIAGPVGEALVMTGLGLAVAIPAVVAYNVFTRKNRLLITGLEAFAFELMSFMSLGAGRKLK